MEGGGGGLRGRGRGERVGGVGRVGGSQKEERAIWDRGGGNGEKEGDVYPFPRVGVVEEGGVRLWGCKRVRPLTWGDWGPTVSFRKVPIPP